MSAPPNGAANDLDRISPLRAIHSLRRDHLAPLSWAVRQFPGGWSLDCHEGYDGDLTAIISRADHAAASFVVSRTQAGFHLALSQGDRYERLGSFAALDDLIAFVSTRLERDLEPNPINRAGA